MARTTQQIYDDTVAELVAQYAAVGVVIDPTLWGKYNIRRLFCWTFAACAMVLEKLFDDFTALVKSIIATTKPHKLQWYVTMAKSFQYGHALVTDSDSFDNTGLTDAQIDTEKVVKFAAAEEIVKGVRLKLAGITGGDLAPLTAPQFNALKAYMQIIKDAGVKLYFVNDAADNLRLNMRIYYDPLVLDATGQRLDGTDNTPVQAAIDDYIKNGISFNSLFIPTKLTDRVQEVEGVMFPIIDLVQARAGLLPYTAVDAEYKPNAGYLRFANPVTDLTLTFIPHGQI